MSQGDPVSWFLIEPGWKVLDGDGNEIGHVHEVVGDSGADIFSGLSISVGLLKGNRYVPAEVVGSITEGVVRLSLPGKQLDSLGHYDRPPRSERILPPDRKS
jgi:uncharacterized protein YrrD